MRCPAFSEIVDRVDNRDKSAKVEKIDGHIGQCRPCKESRDWVSGTIRTMRGHSIYDAPESLVSNAIALFHHKRKGLQDLVKAVLKFDSWTVPALAGVRAQDRSPRQLMYQTESYQVFVMLLPGESGAMVLGQIISMNQRAGALECYVALRSQNRVLSREKTNAAGEFFLSSKKIGSRKLSNHRFDLVIYGNQECILIPSFEMGL